MSLAFLISATEVHELLRLPRLLAHYQEHHKNDPSMGVADYLGLHYSKTHPNDQDEEEDSQLPFKETQVCHVDLSDIPVFTDILLFRKQVSLKIPPTMGKPLTQSFSIFRPPQFV